MAKCPNCGAEVTDPVKSWDMIGKPDKSGEMFKLTMGLYNCICSEKSFRSVIGKEKITLKGVIEKNNSLEEQLMEATCKKSELESIVKTLEDEKAQLLAEVEVLRAIPVLEEKVTSLEADLVMLRAEKGALMFKLTKLVSEPPSSVHLAPMEKPLEAYISEAVNAEEIVPIKESICGCPSAEIEALGTVTEPPTIDAVSTETSPQNSLPVDAFKEPVSDVPQIETTPVDALLQEAIVSNSDISSDKTPLSVQPEYTIEIKANDFQPIESPPVDVMAVKTGTTLDSVSAKISQIEVHSPEVPLVVEIAEATSNDLVSIPVSLSEPHIAQVEALNELAPESSLALITPVESANMMAEEVEEKSTESSEPLIEAKPVEDCLDETAQTGLTTSLEEKPVEAYSSVITSSNVPSIDIVPSEENSTLPGTVVVASVEALDEEISEMAKEVEEERPVEAIVSDSASLSASESIQLESPEAAPADLSAGETMESIVTRVVEPQPVEIFNVETLVNKPVSVETIRTEAPIAETPVVENLIMTSLDDVVTTTIEVETSNQVEEKKLPLFVI